MKAMKKTLSILLALTLIVGVFAILPMSASAEDADISDTGDHEITLAVAVSEEVCDRFLMYSADYGYEGVCVNYWDFALQEDAPVEAHLYQTGSEVFDGTKYYIFKSENISGNTFSHTEDIVVGAWSVGEYSFDGRNYVYLKDEYGGIPDLNVEAVIPFYFIPNEIWRNQGACRFTYYDYNGYYHDLDEVGNTGVYTVDLPIDHICISFCSMNPNNHSNVSDNVIYTSRDCWPEYELWKVFDESFLNCFRLEDGVASYPNGILEVYEPSSVIDDELSISFDPAPSRVKYNGRVRNPKVIVTNRAGDVLVKDVDYTLDIPEGRINAGDYVYTATGIGDYEGLTAEGVFTIHPQSIKASLNANKLAYTGKQRNPSVIVKDANGNLLTENEDYIVDYPEGRTEVGDYVYTITGIGNYKGTVTRTLTIAYPVKAKLNASTLKYTGKQRNPKVIVFNAGGEPMTEGVDYTVTVPEGRTEPGEYFYTVKGIGAYCGEVRLKLTITQA